jgi:hypothetical protein
MNMITLRPNTGKFFDEKCVNEQSVSSEAQLESLLEERCAQFKRNYQAQVRFGDTIF